MSTNLGIGDLVQVSWIAKDHQVKADGREAWKSLLIPEINLYRQNEKSIYTDIFFKA